MQSVTPTSQYLKALNEGSHQPDDVQKEAVSRLEIIYQELINSTPPAPRTSGLMARVGKLWGKREDTKHMPVRGLYMWGGVGRGKTWLMDLFYQSLPGERKQRLHFHRFMRWKLLPIALKQKLTCSVLTNFLFLILPMPCYLAV